MDKRKSQQLEKVLLGKNISDYTIVSLINNGKSAAVFKAEDLSKNFVALKIFDNDMVEKFGHEVQEMRIQQEISLKGHAISNLIKITDGGKCVIDNETYYYIVMEFIDGKNLKEFIQKDTYDNLFLKKLTSVLLSVSEELLQQGIAHRDIKPENIMVSNTGEIVLMDLGVLKFVDMDSFSDLDEKQFLGTLQYGPPEFLSRTEENSTDGWRAINLYQIGGVLHDLIMKKELFIHHKPYTNLVKAIFNEVPVISNNDFPFKTNQLARNLLIKNPKERLERNPLSSIVEFCSEGESNVSSLEKELDEIFTMTYNNKIITRSIEDLKRTKAEIQTAKEQISTSVEKVLDNCMALLKSKRLFTNFEKSIHFKLEQQGKSRSGFLVSYNQNIRQPEPILQHIPKANKDYLTKNYFYVLDGEYAMGYIGKLFMLVRIENDENSFTTISFASIFFDSFTQQGMTLKDPLVGLFRLAEKNKNSLLQSNHITYTYEIKTKPVFSGVIGFDSQIVTNISSEMVKVIKTALKATLPEVAAELSVREMREKGIGLRMPTITHSKVKDVFFNEIDL